MRNFTNIFISLLLVLVGNFSYATTDITPPVSKAALSAGISVKVNINRAGADELAKLLLGIGQSKAQEIVKYREKNGPFTKKEQLMNVSGIGKATLAKNSMRINL